MKITQPLQTLPIAAGVLCLAGLSACTIVIPLPPLKPATVGSRAPQHGNDVTQRVDFVRQIKPIFEDRCLRCHHAQKAQAGLDLQDRDRVFAATQMIVRGDAENSRLYRAVSGPYGHPESTPGDSWWLSPRHRRLLRNWINQGADWPSGKAGQLQRREP